MKPRAGHAALMSLALALCAHASAFAQGAEKKADDAPQQTQRQRPRTAAPAKARDEKAAAKLQDEKAAARPDAADQAQSNRLGQPGGESDSDAPYYNNFLTSYKLGPEDVISVSVFGLDKYSRANIVVPPDGRIDYYMIPGGLQVTGKTRQQVEEEIAHHLDEYIYDPKVTVTLEKAMSVRYAVIGDVAQPGIRPMTRRLSVYEALTEAGGILRTGKKQVVVLHMGADRMLKQDVIDVAAIERGKLPDNYFLSPGDQVFVPGNRWKTVDQILKALPVLSFARIFTGGW